MIRKLFPLVFVFSATLSTSAQTVPTLMPASVEARTTTVQTVANSLVTLPEADTLIYVNPQRILNDAAPKVMAAADVSQMREAFAEIKKGAGVDPASIESLVIALRFHKPGAALNFVAPDAIAVISGDFSADSLITTARLYLQDGARDEKHGTKTLTVISVDPLKEMAEKNPILKPFTEIAFVALNTNTIAIGNVQYVKAAVDAAEGSNRINVATINSLLRDPNALMSASGSPLSAFAKSFGLAGTEATPRERSCDSKFGDFYAALTMDGDNFSFHSAMNADNPDTAKIIHNLFAGLLQQLAGSVPDQNVQNFFKNLKMTVVENEVIVEGSVPQQMVADLIKNEKAQKTTATAPTTAPKRAVRKRRIRRH